MISIIDYGMGNLRSVEKALLKLGHPAEVTSDPGRVAASDRVILPGVGAFGAAMANLTRSEAGIPPLAEAVKEAVASGKPFLGICLGMQLVLSESEELGHHRGLDLIPGEVRRFDFNGDPRLKVPHMGWNELRVREGCPLLAGVETGERAYFVHSYYCRPEDPGVVAATSEHGFEFCAVLARDNIYAAQFHPEKSGATGLRLLDNFARLPE